MAHLAGLSIALWMDRYDLLIAGIAFGIPSTLLFFDLLPGGRNRIVSMIERIVR
jgi:hypothetical protein